MLDWWRKGVFTRPSHSANRELVQSGEHIIANSESLRVGVTGHRTLENMPALRLRVAEVLGEIQRQAPSPHLTIVSSLAEGADRLVPEVALARGQASLCAILPLAAGDYSDDFTTPESRAEFRALLRRSEDTLVIEPRPSRKAAYAAVGHQIVSQSDVLIAIWDGQPARGPGGTAEIVGYAEEHGVPVYWIDPAAPSGFILRGGGAPREVAPIDPKAEADPPPADLTELGPWGEDFEACCRRLEDGLSSAAQDKLNARLATIVSHFRVAYDEAEARAQSLQGKYRRASIASFSLAALAVLIVSAQSILHLDHWVIVGEVVAIGLILVIYHLGKHREWHFHWMESRLEAEWIRNGIFVAFLRGKSIPGIDRHWACRWVTGAASVRRVRSLWAGLPSLPTLEEDDLPLLKEYMATVWLGQQKRYHREKSLREEAKHRRISRAGEIMFWGTCLAALLHLLPHEFYHRLHWPEGPIVNTLTLLAIGLPTLGAALAGLRGHFEFNKIASRSAMMADHLAELEEDLAQDLSVAELGKIVEETETLMLQENSDWYFTIGMHHIEKG